MVSSLLKWQTGPFHQKNSALAHGSAGNSPIRREKSNGQKSVNRHQIHIIIRIIDSEHTMNWNGELHNEEKVCIWFPQKNERPEGYLKKETPRCAIFIMVKLI